VTQVNEFLTQMENFPGIFVASSNLIDGFDPAALRRFDLKAKFDYLRSDQTVALLQAHLAHAGLPPAGAEVDGRLRRLSALAPGDFAAVARQHRFRPLRTPEDWVLALEAECRHKPGARIRPAIGFGGAAA
jgi:SpoVK/Ycf46/Vps4 family AAA+-type ATPase